MKVIDIEIETNAIHKGFDSCGGKPLPVEYDTGVITIPEIPQYNSHTGNERPSSGRLPPNSTYPRRLNEDS